MKFSFIGSGPHLTRSVLSESDRIDDHSAGSTGGAADPWCRLEVAMGVGVTSIPVTTEVE